MECKIIPNHSKIIEDDHAYVWHPFTQAQTAQSPIAIVRGQGSYLFSAEGKSYLDGISSWWVNLHGHSHPYIVQKIKEQAEVLEHVIFAGFTHPTAVELASQLLKILPGHMNKIFYTDNGSTAVEVALKMVFQFWYNLKLGDQRTKIVCFKASYHGDTFGAMSASGKNAFNKPFWKYLFDVEMIDPPFVGHETRSLQQLKKICEKGNVACFIFEPLILGVGGMITYSVEGLNTLLKLCRQYQVLTIADEVMTGFARTGTLFASHQLQETADIICLSKGLTGGFLPLGVTACREIIYQAFLGKDVHQALLHGHSYTANPLACSSALASLELLLKKECATQRQMIAEEHKKFCEEWKSHPKLKRCESLGTILSLEYHTGGKSSYFQTIRDQLYDFFIKQGILLRPLGNVLYVLPPYCIQKEELQFIYEHIIMTLERPRKN